MDQIIFADVFHDDRLVRMAREGVAKVVVVSDAHVAALYAQRLLDRFQVEGVHAHLMTVPPGESSKSRAMKAKIEDQMLALGCGRDTLVIALGGGVITDLVGFVAATYCRGVPVIYIPTSLLGMVDAAIGGKTGINTLHGKNLLGTFTQPKAIFIDVSFLPTLPRVEYIAAFSEIIKHALVFDADYFAFMESSVDAILQGDTAVLGKIIRWSCEIKSRIVCEDEKENGLREILNAGHSIGHAIEVCSEHAIAHGQAVAMGLLIEAELSHRMGYMSSEAVFRIRRLFEKLSMPLAMSFPQEDMIKALRLDKKNRQGQMRFVIIQTIGKAVVHVVDPQAVADVLDVSVAA